MRMRKKPNLIPRMERCAQILVREPAALRGKWLEAFPGHRALHLELGCGKGRFTQGTAQAAPEVLLAAVERVPDAMVVAMERAFDSGVTNARFMDMDAAKLSEVFAPGEAERIYINFCDPWHKSRHADRRLTAPGFLQLYHQVLAPGGEIHFKTDNNPLFEFSLESFERMGYTLKEVTRDLHADGPWGVMTDYEEKFYAQGLPINRCVAVRPDVLPPLPDKKKKAEE